MNAIKQWFARVRNSPWFVVFTTTVATALGAQAQAWASTGVFNESLSYWEKTLVAAALFATASVYHLNLTPQNPDGPAPGPGATPAAKTLGAEPPTK